MGFIIIGIILAVVIFFICAWHWSDVLLYLAAVVFLIGLLLGLAVPGEPIEKKLIEKTNIISLSDGMHVSGGGLFYVRINSNNSYSYYYEVDSDYKQSENEKSYKQGTVAGNNVTIVEYENSNDETPAFYEYEFGTHGNFWTFDTNGIKHEYVFRVPKGTVVQQFELNGR